MNKDIEILVSLKNDLIDCLDWLKGEHIKEDVYISDFFARNQQFDDSEENINLYKSYVGQLFNEYVYSDGIN